jgi:hypothetical protein
MVFLISLDDFLTSCQDMFYMDDVNDADQEEDEGAASKGEEEEGLEPVPISGAATTPLLPRNFSRGKRAGIRIRVKFIHVA